MPATKSRPADYLTQKRQNERIEGPTNAQARKLARLRTENLAAARIAEAAGRDESAFDLDCAAWDLEADLRAYGFDIETGRPVR
jgi:hypothetical protein